MNKVYKDGIGWVAIVKNSSCVSSSKGSGTVVEKSGVEVLKNFFDLRNSVVLNNGFLLKGLFVATLFCGVFVGDLKAEVTPDITRQQLVTQMNGNIVYTKDGGDRVTRFVKSMDGYIDGQGRGYIDINGQWYEVDSYDERGVITLRDGKRYVLPTGTLARADGKLSEVRFFEFGEKFTGAGKGTNKEVVRYDAKEKKWFVYNLADDEKLYAVKSGNSIKYFRIGDLKKNSDGTLYIGPDGYYVSTSLINANEQGRGELIDNLNLIKTNKPDIDNKSPDRLSLVGLDGISTMPYQYEANGTIPAGRKVGDNKNGKIRLGNVAKAKLDDEAVNLGQLNEKLKNLNTGTGKVPYIDINSSITGPSSNYDNDGAIGKDAIAIGPNAKAGDNSVAVGFGAKTGEGVIDRDSYNIGSNSLVGFKKQLQKNINEAVKKRDEAVENYNKAITYPDKSKYGRIKNEQQELINKYEKIKATYEKIIDSYEAQYEYNGKLITQAEFDKLPRTEKMKIRKTVRYKSNAFYENSVAIGHDAHTLANDAVAIGSGAKVIANGGVAIGQGSVSNVRATDLVGYEPLASDINKSTDYFIKHQKSTWEATDQPFAVGDDTSKEKITRQITGVAAGTRDTDAVNVAQLKQIGLYAEGDIGDIGDKIHTEKKGYNTLKIKTDGNWEDNKTNVVYTGKNLETRFTKGYFDQNAKKDVNSKFEIAMTDKPRFKSITIADDNVTKNQEDKSPIELKKFGKKTIGFAGENNSTIKLTNLDDGNITKDSTDAVTGKQLYDVNQTVNKGFLHRLTTTPQPTPTSPKAQKSLTPLVELSK